jgi:hypothetical protein
MKAFPQNEATMHIDLPLENQQGMDLRDYFAAKAMQGLFFIYGNIKVDEGNTKVKFIAQNAYVMADAMMEARK